MPANDDGITLKTVLGHMQNMQRVLTAEIAKVGSRIGGLETRMGRIEMRLDRMETNLTRQIDAIDHRLDAIEIEKHSQRAKVTEERLTIR